MRPRALGLSVSPVGSRNAAARFLNGLWRNIADDTVTLGAHLVRRHQVEGLPATMFRNAFAARLDRAYRTRVLQDRLYQNDWYLSVIVAPRTPGGQAAGRQLNKALARLRKHGGPVDPESLVAIEDLWTTLARSLEGYDLQRLGLRDEGGVLFSEIAAALRLILTVDYLPMPLVSGPLGNCIYTDRAIFGRHAYEIRSPGGSRYGAVFGLREYMAATHPGLFDALLPLPMPLVLSQSWRFLARPDALGKLSLKAQPDDRRRRQGGLADRRPGCGTGPAGLGRVCDGQPSPLARGLCREPLRARAPGGDRAQRARQCRRRRGAGKPRHGSGVFRAAAGQSRMAHPARRDQLAQLFASGKFRRVSAWRAPRPLGAGDDAVPDDRRHRLRFHPACRRRRDDGDFRAHRVGQKHVFDPSGDVRPVPRRRRHRLFLR